jgi:hypothetical protein
MSGDTLSFTEADLAAAARVYDPALHEAPIVVGHPAHDLPAYGWVSALAFSDGADPDQDPGLYATPAQVNTDFADMVAAGAFKKISAAFYAPTSPSNPVPGSYYLRHVGFLGAQPPAVKGLRSPSFADAEDGVVVFSEWDDQTNASLWRGLRDWLIGKFGQDEADKVVPSYQVASLEQGAQQELANARQEMAGVMPAAFADATPTQHPTKPSPKPVTPQLETTVNPEEAAALAADNQRMAAELATLKAQAEGQRVATIHAANLAYCEGLVSSAKLLPAAKDVLVAALDHLDLHSTTPATSATTSATDGKPQALTFGEGDAKQPLAQALRDALAKAPAAVVFGETATKARSAGDVGGDASDDSALAYAENADPLRVTQDKKVRAHMTANPGLTYAAAARAVLG